MTTVERRSAGQSTNSLGKLEGVEEGAGWMNKGLEGSESECDLRSGCLPMKKLRGGCVKILKYPAEE